MRNIPSAPKVRAISGVANAPLPLLWRIPAEQVCVRTQTRACARWVALCCVASGRLGTRFSQVAEDGMDGRLGPTLTREMLAKWVPARGTGVEDANDAIGCDLQRASLPAVLHPWIPEPQLYFGTPSGVPAVSQQASMPEPNACVRVLCRQVQ